MKPTAFLDSLHRLTVQRVKDSLKAGKLVPTRSPRWPSFRRSFLAIHSACEACGGIHSLEVHHVQSFHEHPELELDPSNLMTLCDSKGGPECHLQVGHRFGMMVRGNWKVNNPKARIDARTIRNRQLIKRQ